MPRSTVGMLLLLLLLLLVAACAPEALAFAHDGPRRGNAFAVFQHHQRVPAGLRQHALLNQQHQALKTDDRTAPPQKGATTPIIMPTTRCAGHTDCAAGLYCRQVIGGAVCSDCIDYRNHACDAWGDSVDGKCAVCVDGQHENRRKHFERPGKHERREHHERHHQHERLEHPEHEHRQHEHRDHSRQGSPTNAAEIGARLGRALGAGSLEVGRLLAGAADLSLLSGRQDQQEGHSSVLKLAKWGRPTFEQFDSDGNGKLSPKELAKALIALPRTKPKYFPPGAKFMSIDEMMAAMDADGDGSIDLDEWLQRLVSCVGLASALSENVNEQGRLTSFDADIHHNEQGRLTSFDADIHHNQAQARSGCALCRFFGRIFWFALVIFGANCFLGLLSFFIGASTIWAKNCTTAPAVYDEDAALQAALAASLGKEPAQNAELSAAQLCTLRMLRCRGWAMAAQPSCRPRCGTVDGGCCIGRFIGRLFMIPLFMMSMCCPLCVFISAGFLFSSIGGCCSSSRRSAYQARSGTAAAEAPAESPPQTQTQTQTEELEPTNPEPTKPRTAAAPKETTSEPDLEPLLTEVVAPTTENEEEVTALQAALAASLQLASTSPKPGIPAIPLEAPEIDKDVVIVAALSAKEQMKRHLLEQLAALEAEPGTDDAEPEPEPEPQQEDVDAAAEGFVEVVHEVA